MSEARWSGVTELSSRVTPGVSELLLRIAETFATSLLRIANLSSCFQSAFCAASGVKQNKQRHRTTSLPHHPMLMSVDLNSIRVVAVKRSSLGLLPASNKKLISLILLLLYFLEFSTLRFGTPF